MLIYSLAIASLLFGSNPLTCQPTCEPLPSGSPLNATASGANSFGSGSFGSNGFGDSFWDLSPPEPEVIDCPLSPPPVEIGEWSKGDVWDDGRAEIATYSAILGMEEDFEATMITVKETYSSEESVKAEEPYSGGDFVDSLKVNWMQKVPFGSTPVNWLTSIFVRRDNPFQLLKATHSSQAWDGNYFRKIRVDKGDVEDVWHSFVEGEAQGERSFSEEPFVTPEQLVVALRSIEPSEGLNFNVRLSRPIRNARYQKFEISGAQVLFESDEMSADAGNNETVGNETSKSWKVTVQGADFQWRYWYADTPERHLLRLEGPDLCLKLKNVERRAYWLPQTDP